MSCFYSQVYRDVYRHSYRYSGMSYSDSDPVLVLDKYYCSDDIIIFVFLIAGVCVGLPALVWALYVLNNYWKNGGGISVFIILLLFNDLLELLLTVFIVSYLFFDHTETFSLQNPWAERRHRYYDYQYVKQISSPEREYRDYDYEYVTQIPSTELSYWDYEYEYVTQISWQERRYLDYGDVYTVVDRLWVMFRIDGLYLHQLVALQSILSLKNRTCSAQVFSPPCSIILYIILSLVVFRCQLVNFRQFLNLVLCLFPFCILGVTCLLTYKFPDRVPHTGRKPRSAVLIVSTVTLFAFCATFVIVLIITDQMRPFMDIYERTYMDIYDSMCAFLVSVRVFSDPLLCVLVCKEKLRDQKQQTDAELNTDLQSV